VLYFQKVDISGDEDFMHRRAGLIFAGLFLFAVTLVHAQNPFDPLQQFSANISGGPLKWDKMKIYRSGNQMRAEYVFENEVRITSLTTRNGWAIRPAKWVTKPKQCVSMTLMDASTYPFFAYTGTDFDVEHSISPEVQKETIDGHPCHAENYTFKQKESGITTKARLWEAEDLQDFPLRIEFEPSAKPKFTMTYTDVKLEKPDPALFKLPPLCRVASKGTKKAPAAAPKTPAKTSPKPAQ
jgi:hypothetical protein